MGPYLQRPRARRPHLPPHRRRRPPFAPREAQALVDAVGTTEPIDHGLSGHGWTLKKLRQWVITTYRRHVGRNAIRRILHAAGQCLIREYRPCDARQMCQFLSEVARWCSGPGRPDRVVVIWDNAPCHIARVVSAHAAELGMELVPLPSYSPDLNPIERLWDGMRAEVTRGHRHASLAGLRSACRQFIARINADATSLIDRLWPKFDLDPEHEAKLLVST